MEAFERAGRGGREATVIDLNRLSSIDEQDARLLAGFVHDVRARRGDYLAEMISLRSGDIEALALQSKISPRTLLARLEPALLERREPPQQ